MSLIKPASEFQVPRGQIIRYGLTGSYPTLTSTVAVAEAFRGAVLSALHAQSGTTDSFLLSGHDATGQPDLDHRHVYYLPKPSLGGRIVEILVVSPFDRFSAPEMDALGSLNILRWNGPSARAGIELLDPDDQGEIKLANRWVSLTPFVPNRRFWGTSGKHHLTPNKQIANELRARGFEGIVEKIEIESWGSVKVRLAPRSKTMLPNTPVLRKAFKVHFASREPLCGLIALGHSSHFGLGQFIPCED